MFNLGFWEIAIILIIAVVLFGRRLPDVGRYLGKGIVEFKKGIKGIEDEVNTSQANYTPNTSAPATAEPPKPPQRIGQNAPKFADADVDSEGQPRFQNS